MNLKFLPWDIEIIINKYIHELKMVDIKKELNKNLKNYFIYTLTWRGNFDYFKAYNNIESDSNLTLFFKNKLRCELSKIVYNDNQEEEN